MSCPGLLGVHAVQFLSFKCRPINLKIGFRNHLGKIMVMKII